MKKVLTILLALTMLVALVACGGETDKKDSSTDETEADVVKTEDDAAEVDEEKEVTIGLSVGHLTEERWQREIEMFEEYAAANNIKLEVQSAEDDPQKQVSQVENMVTMGVDALIVQPIDSEAAGVVCGPAKAAGIPVVSYDRFVMNGDLDYYISFDTIKVGKTQAEFVIEHVDEGNFIWLKGDPADFNAHLLEEGQQEVLAPYVESGAINIVAEQWVKGWGS